MDVVGHEDEGVQLIAALGAVVVEKLEEQVDVRVGLKNAAAIRGDGGDEEGAEFLRGEIGHAVKVACGAERRKITAVWKRPGAQAPLFLGLLFHGLKAVASTVASLREAIMCCTGSSSPFVFRQPVIVSS